MTEADSPNSRMNNIRATLLGIGLLGFLIGLVVLSANFLRQEALPADAQADAVLLNESHAADFDLRRHGHKRIPGRIGGSRMFADVRRIARPK